MTRAGRTMLGVAAAIVLVAVAVRSSDPSRDVAGLRFAGLAALLAVTCAVTAARPRWAPFAAAAAVAGAGLLVDRPTALLVAGGAVAVVVVVRVGSLSAAVDRGLDAGAVAVAAARRRHRAAVADDDGRDDTTNDPPPDPGFRVPALAWLAVLVVGSWAENIAVRTAKTGWKVANLLPWPSFTTGKGGWDTIYYVNISRIGYHLPAGQTFTTRPADDLVAYFPGYPLLIRALSAFPLVNEPLAASMLAAAAGFASTLLFWKWMQLKGMGRSAMTTALALFLLYPYAFMLIGVAYSDPVALAFLLAAVVLVERDRHVAAGLFGAAATATRPNAIPLIAALPMVAFARTSGAGSVARRLRSRWGVALAVAGVGAYGVWLAVRYGDPFAFWTTQRNYGQGRLTDIGTWLKVDFFRSLPTADWDGETVNRIAAACCTLVTLLCVPKVGRRFGWGYAVLVGGVAATVLAGARYFSPGGRYLLLAFPVMALGGRWLAPRPRTRAVVVGAFAAGWMVLVVRFAHTDSLGW